jgi:5-formyltetrahydrofolate cyclo-ligase
MIPPVAADKRSLRREALARRGEVEPHVRAQFSSRLAKFGLEMAQRLHAGAISVFYPIRDEPDTLALLAALDAHGFRTALPITVARGAPLIFRQWRPGDPTAPGAMNIPEPLASAPALDPDLMFVPLACFDRRGHRVGYGAGHYDRTLERLRDNGGVTAVGVAFACAEVGALPDEAHDQRLDYILTERELIDCRTA